MDFTENTIETNRVYSGIVVNVRLDTVSLPNGNTARREVVEHPGGVTVLPVDASGRAYCVRQYRYAYRDHLLEAPAGKLEPGEEPLDCAKRELSEETGFSAGRYEYLGAIYPSPGFSREILHIYLALDLQPGDSHPDPDEFVSVETHPLAELEAMIAKNEIKDAKTIVAVLRAKQFFAEQQ